MIEKTTYNWLLVFFLLVLGVWHNEARVANSDDVADLRVSLVVPAGSYFCTHSKRRSYVVQFGILDS